MTHYLAQAGNPEHKGAPLPNSDAINDVFASHISSHEQLDALQPGRTGSGGGLLRSYARDTAEVILMDVMRDDDETLEDDDKVARRTQWMVKRTAHLVSAIQEFHESDTGLIDLSQEASLVDVPEEKRAFVLAQEMIKVERIEIEQRREEARLNAELARHAVHEIQVATAPQEVISEEVASPTKMIELPHVEMDAKETKRFKKVLRGSLRISKQALELVGVLAPQSANIDVVRPAPMTTSPVEYR